MSGRSRRCSFQLLCTLRCKFAFTLYVCRVHERDEVARSSKIFTPLAVDGYDAAFRMLHVDANFVRFASVILENADRSICIKFSQRQAAPSALLFLAGLSFNLDLHIPIIQDNSDFYLIASRSQNRILRSVRLFLKPWVQKNAASAGRLREYRTKGEQSNFRVFVYGFEKVTSDPSASAIIHRTR